MVTKYYRPALAGNYYISPPLQVFHVAHAMACRAAEVNPESADAHRWIAILSYYRAEKEGRPASVLNLEGGSKLFYVPVMWLII